MSPDQREGVFGALGGREIERGHGPCAICRANVRADKRLGADAKQRHEANHDAKSIMEVKTFLSLAKYREHLYNCVIVTKST